MKERRRKIHFCGYLVDYSWFVISNCRPDFGYHRIGLSYFIPKESQLDYKIEKILNILGIVISVVNWIVAIALIFR